MSQELPSSRKTTVPLIGDCLQEWGKVVKPMAYTSEDRGGDLEVALRSRENLGPTCRLQACQIHKV